MIVLPLALCSAVCGEDRSPAVLLEQAIFQETVLADLEQAIETYHEVRAHPDAGLLTQLESTYRSAECHDLLGNTFAAWFAFEEVERAEANVPDLATLALEQQVILQMSLAENETDYDAIQAHYLGDLLLLLDGALRHRDERATSLVPLIDETVTALRDQAASTADEEALIRIRNVSVRLLGMIRRGEWEQAQVQLSGEAFFQAIAAREALSDEDEIFGYALEMLDEVVRSLNRGEKPKAEERLKVLQRYLEPLRPWPLEAADDEVVTYSERLGKLVDQLETHLTSQDADNEIWDALESFFGEQAASGGMAHFHVDESILEEFYTSTVLPHVGGIMLLLEQFAERIDAEELVPAVDSLEQAVQRGEALAQITEGTSDQLPVERLVESLKAMQSLARQEDWKAVRDQFERVEGSGNQLEE